MLKSYLEVTPHLSIPVSEIRFRTSRSGGPGGQNVNKVETKVELLFDVGKSPSINETQRRAISDHLAERIDSSGVLKVVSRESRSQFENKERAMHRLVELLRKALRPKKLRIKTRPTRSAAEKRILAKRHRSEKKWNRKPDFD